MGVMEFVLIFIEILLCIAAVMIMCMAVLLLRYLLDDSKQGSQKGEGEQGSGLKNLLQPEREDHPTEGTAESEES